MLPVFAQDSDSQSPLIRPAGSSPRLNGKIIDVFVDSFNERFFVLEGSGVTLKMPPLNGWVEDDSDPTASYALKYRDNPQVRLSFKLYRQKNFIEKLDESTLSRYADLLVSEYGPHFKITNADKHFKPSNSFFIFDEKYNEVDGTYVDRTGNEISVRDYVMTLSGLKNYCMIIRLEGDSQWFAKVLGTVRESFRHSAFLKPGEN